MYTERECEKVERLFLLIYLAICGPVAGLSSCMSLSFLLYLSPYLSVSCPLYNLPKFQITNCILCPKIYCNFHKESNSTGVYVDFFCQHADRTPTNIFIAFEKETDALKISVSQDFPPSFVLDSITHLDP